MNMKEESIYYKRFIEALKKRGKRVEYASENYKLKSAAARRDKKVGRLALSTEDIYRLQAAEYAISLGMQNAVTDLLWLVTNTDDCKNTEERQKECIKLIRAMFNTALKSALNDATALNAAGIDIHYQAVTLIHEDLRNARESFIEQRYSKLLNPEQTVCEGHEKQIQEDIERRKKQWEKQKEKNSD